MQKAWVNPEKQLLQKFLDLQLVTYMEVEMSNVLTNDFTTLVCGELSNLRELERSSGSTYQMTHESVVLEQYRSLSGCTSHIDPTMKSYHTII